MPIFQTLRFVAYARRAVRALESIAESLSTLRHYYEAEWTEKHAPRPPAGKKTVVEHFDPLAASERYYNRMHEEGR